MSVRVTEHSCSLKRCFPLIAKGGTFILVVYFCFWEIDWKPVFHILASVDWKWGTLSVLSFFFTLGMKILRWGVLLRLVGGERDMVASQDLIAPFFVGQAVNIVMPFRGGEVLRLSWLGVKDKRLMLPGAFSILLEKWEDLLFLSLLTLVLAPWVSEWIKFPPVYSWFLAGLVLLILGGVVWAIRFFNLQSISFIPQPFREVLGPEIGRLQQRLNLTKRHLFLVFLSVFLSMLIWGSMILTNLFTLQALALPVNVKIAGVILVFVYVSLIPALIPGNVGPFHGAVVLGMSLFQIPLAPSLSFAILLHGIVTVFPLVVSALILFWGRWKKP
ncbi:lysylphosphatidylglycerol synthase transmembrane domain-containing protein [Anaerolinea thermophila]|uniref:Hypothetical membrane protein n=1 Tax=Anaerolinea thermophila (strain DSM 14523 / JCM 11388 / NBRC 100420 / UNI-1) TaxID=926569 RepID=E8N6B8_ANATU|nr:lysylphosphatidylglycerol synthase transmembrane domain-containing protein [Anaerolinea thermophila]BAJ63982.1 hypothetical membrane protein [Anaerolinea thermophila UNI-1]